ncbi:MAG: primosome assembly protein PriA [Tetrasphaera jenkinsii]|jgi:primosomal protein N' (replication factor Y)|nr:primosome assembly protein PriA [Tetrasphaera jenkinsii]
MAKDETQAVTDPVAVVLVDSGLPHLDRPFEYAVPAALAEAAQPGVRVKVRFAGRDVPGFVIERRSGAEHEGRLTPIRTVVSSEPVLTPAILGLAREVAQAYAGTVGDVLRLAVPPRHARAEAALSAASSGARDLDPRAPDATAWEPYPAGAALLRHLREGRSPVAAWSAIPAATRPEVDWPRALAQACAATASGGRGAIVIVPDQRDLDRVDQALRAELGPGRHVLLTAEQGPQARYTAWLTVLRGQVSVVAGTRSAAFAPMPRLGLLAVWDDGDDLHEEPRAPYHHVRELALIRGRREAAAVLIGGFGRTVASMQLVEQGVARAVDPDPVLLRAAMPRILVAGEGRELERDSAAASARLPSLAWRTATAALTSGPVLVQVPRRGYIPALACQNCRARARCQRCEGPLGQPVAGQPPLCRWCASPAPAWTCPACGDRRLRSLVIGSRRTAEELGRAFPGVPLVRSSAGEVKASVGPRPALVIATPGAEPIAEGGYAAALLLDAWALLDRPSLDAGPEALRRWLAAAALVRPATGGGTAGKSGGGTAGRTGGGTAGTSGEGVVVLCGAAGESAIPAVEALVRWDPRWLAERELREREALRLPPVSVMAAVSGPRAVLAEVAQSLEVPPSVARFGPSAIGPSAVGQDDLHRLVFKADAAEGAGLARALSDARAARSARKETPALGVRMRLTDLD